MKSTLRLRDKEKCPPVYRHTGNATLPLLTNQNHLTDFYNLYHDSQKQTDRVMVEEESLVLLGLPDNRQLLG